MQPSTRNAATSLMSCRVAGNSPARAPRPVPQHGVCRDPRAGYSHGRGADRAGRPIAGARFGGGGKAGHGWREGRAGTGEVHAWRRRLPSR